MNRTAIHQIRDPKTNKVLFIISIATVATVAQAVVAEGSAQASTIEQPKIKFDTEDQTPEQQLQSYCERLGLQLESLPPFAL